MEKCNKQGCNQTVGFCCYTCRNQSFWCKDHVIEHFLADRSHDFKPFSYTLSDEEKARIKKRIQERLLMNKNLINKTVEKVNSLVIRINIQAKKFFSEVMTDNNKMMDVLKEIETLELVHQNYYQNFMNMPDYNSEILLSNIDHFSSIVEKVFSNERPLNDNIFVDFLNSQRIPEIPNSANVADSLTEEFRYIPQDIESEISAILKLPSTADNDSNILFFSDRSVHLNIIDLNTFEQKKVKTFPNNVIGLKAQACKVSKNIYFCNGGENLSGVISTSLLVNFEKNTWNLLPNATVPRRSGGCVLKDQNIYVFGGANDQGLLKNCEKFDVNLFAWSSFSELPIASNGITTVLFENKVILTGNQLGNAFVYDITKNSYLPLISLPVNKYKCLCDRFLLVNGLNKIFECQSLSNNQ